MDLSELALRVTPLHHLTPLVAYRLRNEEIHSTIILTAFFFLLLFPCKKKKIRQASQLGKLLLSAGTCSHLLCWRDWKADLRSNKLHCCNSTRHHDLSILPQQDKKKHLPWRKLVASATYFCILAENEDLPAGAGLILCNEAQRCALRARGGALTWILWPHHKKISMPAKNLSRALHFLPAQGRGLDFYFEPPEKTAERLIAPPALPGQFFPPWFCFKCFNYAIRLSCYMPGFLPSPQNKRYLTHAPELQRRKGRS